MSSDHATEQLCQEIHGVPFFVHPRPRLAGISVHSSVSTAYGHRNYMPSIEYTAPCDLVGGNRPVSSSELCSSPTYLNALAHLLTATLTQYETSCQQLTIRTPYTTSSNA